MLGYRDFRKRLCVMLRFLSLVLALVSSGASAGAESYARIDPGDRQRVEAHGVCRQVTNGNPDPVMIPLSTPEEWSVGGASFLAEARVGMTVAPCLVDVWAWEYMDGVAVFWQGPASTEYGAGGLPIQTRFTQYDADPSMHFLSAGDLPECGPGRGGERVTFVQGTPGQMAVFLTHVCNNATPVDPFTIPDVTVSASGYWNLPEITLSGIPHNRTEQLIVGVVGRDWVDPNGGCCSFDYDARVRVNGSTRPTGRGLPIGRVSQGYYQAFRDTYGLAAAEGQESLRTLGVAVRNGDRVQVRMRATGERNVTLTYFVKIGQHITYFDVTTT